MEEIKYREIIFYKNYFEDFFNIQNIKIKKKILWTLKLIESLKIIPKEYFKHIENTDGIYEIRIKFGTNIFRIFCFFEKDKIIVIMNGFQKKSQKTPINEIKKAIKIKKEYDVEK